MRHAVTRVSLGWTLLMIAILLLPRAAIAIPRINLEVTLRELPSNSIVLHIKLTNSGPDALSMYQEQLPWGTPSETDVVVFWTYELRAKETPTGQRFDGALLIPRRTP